MSLINQYRINGVLDTSQNVLSNMMLLAQSSGCWVTYDAGTGKWSVVIKEPGTSVKSFDDSNMVGEINITSSPLADIYNICEISFPNDDLDNTTDYVIATLPMDDRFVNELDSVLELNFTTFNTSPQAQLIASHDLKQSRFDKIIDFRTDFTALEDIRAGDIIDVTNTMYGFNQKLFRIIQISEEDTDDGQLLITVSAIEYDPSVYDTSGLTIENRTKANGIPPKITNDELNANDRAAEENNLLNLLLATLGSSLFNMLDDYNSGALGPGEDGGGTPPTSNDLPCEGTPVNLGSTIIPAPPPTPEQTQCGGPHNYITTQESATGPDGQLLPASQQPIIPPSNLSPKMFIPQSYQSGSTTIPNPDDADYRVKITPNKGMIGISMSSFGGGSAATRPTWAPTKVLGLTKNGSIERSRTFTLRTDTFDNASPSLVNNIYLSERIGTPGVEQLFLYSDRINEKFYLYIHNENDTSKTIVYEALFTGIDTPYEYPAPPRRIYKFLVLNNPGGTLPNFNFAKARVLIAKIPDLFTSYKITGTYERPLEIYGNRHAINNILQYVSLDMVSSTLPSPTGSSSTDPIELTYEIFVNGSPRGAPYTTTLQYRNNESYYNPYSITV